LKTEEILFIVFALSLLVQLIYHWLVFARLAFYKEKEKSPIEKAVSVVIVARDEYHNLIHSLEPILNQDYPDFELVVVNDHSTDESTFYLQELAKVYPHLKVVQIDHSINFFSGKKFPLSIGIKSASHDTLLLTDADCLVTSKKWIASMQSAFQTKTQIVLGYAPYKSEAGFLNKLIRFDAFMGALHYLSFSLLHQPYMGVGRNLAYSKSMFYKNHGFINHYKINSGDDDLFINQVANKTNTAICIQPESFTYSVPKKSLGLWLKQKKRHLSTSGLYRMKHRLLLMFYPVSLFLFYALSLFFLIFKLWIWVVLGLVALRLISFLFIQKSALHKLKEQKLLLISPILEVLLYLIQGFVLTLNVFNKTNKWK
jgi:glycosyltransferase involved in cell wall biosynthesis